ncbi:MAG TPA: hypothetical protein PKM73_05145 [Verrucomicrobiota bacterium]|nr:hypothetical protein [Verrucomicrobiota bacterium]HNU53077.1 hypothetical protein [Verrucomicrobiota bacterium]
MKSTTRREFIKGTVVLAGSAWGVQPQAARCWQAEGLSHVAPEAAEGAGGSANGSLLDLVASGYVFRAGAPAGQNPKETQWLTEGKEDALAGVMWEEHRPVRQVEVTFAQDVPDRSPLILEVATNTPTEKQDNRPSWWTRKYEPFPGAATRGANGRQVVYTTEREAIVQRLAQYDSGFRYEADPHGLILIDRLRVRFQGMGPRPAVTALRAYGVSSVTPLRVEIEWGLQTGQRSRAFDGHLEIYNGRLGSLRPLADGVGVTLNGPGAWRSAPAARGRRGIAVELFYVANDAQEVRFKPAGDLPTGSNGLLTYHPNRTVVTVRTAGGTFSFAPRDLEAGEPVFVPSLGFCVSRGGSGQSATSLLRQWVDKKLATTRQRVRQRPEQSLAQVLADHYGAQRPAYPKPEAEPPMQIEVPDELASAAWRLAFWHVKRRCVLESGTYQIVIWPYRALLGQESWRIFNALDQLGEHDIPRSGFGPWFKSQGQMVARGMFSGRAGALNVSGWDLNHAQGHGSMLYAMAQHYRLSGDKPWLTEHLANFKAACEWIVQQRQRWIETAGPDTWSAGLIPPCEMGDYADWRCLYQTSVFYWRGLKHAAEAIAELEPDTGAKYRDEAEQLRQAIIRAADRSSAVAPVIRVSDGSYRRSIPPAPYLRGLFSEIGNPFGGAHAGSLVMDSDLGAAALGLGVVPADDPRLDEWLDVLEDNLYRDNWMVRLHTQARQPSNPEAWFSIGGYYYQCGYSQSALAHLLRDDVPNYLRSTFNQYAADVDPDKGYQFREHPNRTGEGNGGDKTFEVGAFLERMRALFVLEDGDQLWLARATPRAWLAQGQRISVRNAPSCFGTVAYEIVSDVDHAAIRASIELPSRLAPQAVRLRFRHPRGARIRSVALGGKAWPDFDPDKELIVLKGLAGKVLVQANY